MSSTVLYFGSFNPVHNGHMAIGSYIVEKGFGSEVLYVVSPQNPLKSSAELAPASDRIAMVRLAIGECMRPGSAGVSAIEFELPAPSYTINTLDALTQAHPERTFAILMGADSAAAIKKWKDWERITGEFLIYVYPRQGYEIPRGMGFVQLADAPQFDISATAVRQAALAGSTLEAMVPSSVAEYIKEKQLWTK